MSHVIGPNSVHRATTRCALALTLLGSLALLGTPTFATETDVDSPAGPELPAPRTDRPDFQQDDQSGAVIGSVAAIHRLSLRCEVFNSCD
jgi:hypothetical protein